MTTTAPTQPDGLCASERHLRAVTLRAEDGQPLRPAEPATAVTNHPNCPPWCVVDHDDPQLEGGSYFHYAAYKNVGRIQHATEILGDGAPVVSICANSDPEYLSLDELDVLIEQLIQDRVTLTAPAPPTGPACASQAGRPSLNVVLPRNDTVPACVPGSANCLPWCIDHAIDERDPHLQICFHDGPSLDFGGRGLAARAWLVRFHPHPLLPQESNRPYVKVSLDGLDGFDLEEAQVEPLARLLLMQLAVMRGDLEGARVLRKRIMTLTSAGSIAATDSPRSAAA